MKVVISKEILRTRNATSPLGSVHSTRVNIFTNKVMLTPLKDREGAEVKIREYVDECTRASALRAVYTIDRGGVRFTGKSQSPFLIP